MSQPITCQVIVSTQDRYVPDQSLKSNLFSISSELGFCARDDSSGQPMLRIVNLVDPQQDTTLPMKADAAILAPHDPTICILRVPTMLQALSLATKQPLGRHTFQQPVNIEYWQWISNDRIAIVCPEAVYAWTYATDQFVLLFNRDPSLVASLQSAKITGLQIALDNDWAILQCVGLDPQSNSVQGYFQFHCFSRNVAKVLPGHASALTAYREDDGHPTCTILSFAHKSVNSVEIDMNMVEAGPQKDAQGNNLSGFVKKQFKIPINPAISAKEFPMFMKASNRFHFTYMITKSGMLYIHDIGSGVTIYQSQISNNGVFAVAEGSNESLVMATVEGNIYKLQIDENTIVDYILQRLGKADVAFKLAIRANLRGADKLFTAQFEDLFNQRKFKEAAQLVKRAPADTLRNDQTLQRFLDAGDTMEMGAKPPVLIYLSTMLENGGKLMNQAESLELVKQFIAVGKLQSIDTFYNQKQLFECEALGDVLLQNGMEQLALRIYNESKSHEKVILYFITHNKLEQIIKYCDMFPDFQPDYASVIQKGLGMGSGFSADGIERLKMFADSIIVKMDIVSQADGIFGVANSFKNFGYVKEATFLMLEVCKRANFGEVTSPYQTYLLVINLEANPQFADAILSKDKLHYFDRTVVYQKCEQAGLYQRAFEFAENDAECLRIAITYGNQLQRPIFDSPEWFAAYCVNCGRFDQSYYNNDLQACVDNLFQFQQSLLDVIVGETRIYAMHVAYAFSRLPVIATSADLIQSAVEVFKAYQLDGSEALFGFLAAIFPSSIDPTIHELYLNCAIQLPGHDADILRVARDSHYIDGSRAFEILTSTPNKSETAVVTALLTICARFKLSTTLIKFLCEAIIKREKSTAYFINNAQQIVEQYLNNFAPEEAHNVLQAMFDNGVLSSNDVGVLDGIFSIDFLSRMLANQQVRDRCDIGLVVEACLYNAKTTKIVRQMLEQRLVSGAIDKTTHTAFAKILVETRANECEKYLIDNPYYDQYEFCLFCIGNEKRRRDSFVQTMAMKAAIIGTFNPQQPAEIRSMKCAHMLVEIAFGCQMYRELSTALLKRGSKQMWEICLIQDLQVVNTDFFTVNNTKSIQIHRENLILAISQNTSVQVELLDEINVAACISPLVHLQDSDPRISKCLMQFLERVILTSGSKHMKTSALHNLLIIAAVKAREITKVGQYVRMAELVYDPDVVAPVCVNVAKEQNLPEFYEDAFEVYRRYDRLTEGIKVLIDYMSLERAEEFAEKTNNANVYVVLAVAQLQISQEHIQQNIALEAASLINKAARNLIKARDGSQYQILVKTVFMFNRSYSNQFISETNQCFVTLIDFLKAARTLLFVQGKYAEHVEVDSALMYSYVKLDKYDELESFLQLVNAAGSGVVPNKGDILQIGDRAFGEQRYVSAKMLYAKINQWSKLAVTLLKLQDYQNAVDAARRADDIPTWREVNAACLLANQINLAKVAGLYLVVNPDELPVISMFYQKNIRIAELIELLEAGIEHPQAKAYTNKEQNIYTHLGLMYARYMWYIASGPEANQRVLRFLKSNNDKVSIPLVIAECKKNLLWQAVVYLYTISNEVDQAVSEVLAHPSSFDHKQLLQICGQVSQPDLLVQLTEFYIKYYPQHINEYLKVSKLGYFQQDEILTTNKRKDFLSVDPVAVLRLAKQYEIELLLRPYFELLVDDGLIDINNELVNIYITQKDSKALIALIKKTTNFDTYKTLERLIDEKQTPALRRAAVQLYSALKRFDDGMQYAIANRYYDEASECADCSENGDKCENLLRMICSNEFPDKDIRREIFAVAVARCGHRAHPDVIMELAWRFNMMDFAMPYLIGQLRTMHDRIAELEHQRAAKPIQLPGQIINQADQNGFGDFQDGQGGHDDNWQTGEGAW